MFKFMSLYLAPRCSDQAVRLIPSLILKNTQTKCFSLVCLFLLVFSLTPLSAQADSEPLTCTTDPMNITVGMVVKCTIDPIVDQDVFRFSGTANTSVVLTLFDETHSGCINGQCPVASLYDPKNTFIRTLGPGIDSQIVLLEKSGTYTIRVAESGNNQTEQYRIGLERLFPASPDASPIAFNSDTGIQTIDPVPDQDFYTFFSWKDSFINLTLSDLTNSGCINGNCPVADLYGPDQKYVMRLGPGIQSKDITLPQEGVYTVHLYESGNNQTESYSLNLQCLFPADGKDDCGKEPTCNNLKPTILGTSGNDVLVGTSGDDVIAGLGGNDRISGLGGNDVICGDSDLGGTGFDTLFGGNGNDQLFGNNGVNVLYGDAGNDTLKGGNNRDSLFGGVGDDTLDARGGGDALVGGIGNDVLKGGSGDNDVCDKKVEDLIPKTGCEINDIP